MSNYPKMLINLVMTIYREPRRVRQSLLRSVVLRKFGAEGMSENLQSLEAILTKLGLTSFEAKVYLTLLTQGPMSTPKLARTLSKHRPQVYTTLSRLSEKGWVEKLSGKPSLFKAVDPEIVLEVALKDLEKNVEYLLEQLKSISGKAKEERYGVWILKSFETLVARAEKVLEDAEIDAIVSGSTRFVKRLMDSIVNAQERGVNVYVLVFTYKGLSFDRKMFTGLKKVKRAVSGDLISLADSEVGVLIKQRRVYSSVEYGLVLEEPAVIDYVLHDFFYRWTRSQTIRDEAVPLPTRFTMHRFAIIEAKRYLRKGVRIGARIRGLNIDAGEDIEVEGEVVGCDLNMKTGLANLSVKVNDSTVLVGGPDAVIEDIAARYIELYEI